MKTAVVRSSFRARAQRSAALSCTLLLGSAALGQLPAGNSWTVEGPAPNLFGQSEGIPNNPVSGAVNSVAPHPTNADILYVGAVNGGIWKTTDATSASPTWTRLTSTEASQSIGTVDFDPTDGTHQTLVAGIGRFSSFAGIGGSRSGLLRTTDGLNFVEIASSAPPVGLAGRNIVGVAARGATIVAAVDIADAFTCGNIGIWRSTNTGATWTKITNGLPAGAVDALAGDPSSTTTLYASMIFAAPCGGGGSGNGIYKSTDTGASWSKVSNAAIDGLLADSSATNVDIVVGNSDNVFVTIVPATGQFGGIFRSGNGGTSWQTLDLPTTFENTSFVGAHPGGQGGLHTSLAADPNNSNILYVGGDRQPLSFGDTFNFPNSIGANNFSGRLFRGDASQPSGNQWTPLTHVGTASNSSPHADSRDLAFDVNGDLIEGDDGGVYRRTSPQDATGDWLSLNDNLQITEQHDLAFDPANDILLSGNQDNASGQQSVPSGLVWSFPGTSGDGGDVVIGPGAVANQTVRIWSSQNLQGRRRATYDASNNLVSNVALPLAGASISPQFKTPLAFNQSAPNRLLVGGANGVFESLNRGDTVAAVPGPAVVADSFFGGASIAAGGVGNDDLLYVAGCVGSCSAGGDDGLYRRTTSGGSLSLAQASSSMVGVAIDPDDATHAFAVDFTNVYRTTNSGASFGNVTGNLPTLNPGTIRTVEYINSPSGDGVVVGTDRGVYLAQSGSGFTTWSTFGHGVPNTPVYELIYDQPNDDLLAGTMGSGAYRMTSVSSNCAESIPLTAGQWRQIALSCDPGPSNTVADVFDDDLAGTYATDWIVYERDESTQSYTQLSLASALSVGDGYWVRTNLGAQAVGNVGMDNVATAVSLVTDSTDGAGCGTSAGRCNMVGNPHAYDVCWADVEVIDGGSTLNLAAADPGGACQGANAEANGCIMSRVAHKWTGSAYAPFDGITPGLEGTLVPWDGFWVSAVKPGLQLRIPETPGNCGAPLGPSAPGEAGPAAPGAETLPEGWYIRLVAESGTLRDAANVLGVLPGSSRHYDPRDLEELAPFGNTYLTIVFPKPDWGPRAGDYSSDFRRLRAGRWLERFQFEVRSSDPSADVTVRWEGLATHIRNSDLRDDLTGEKFRPQPDGSYTFNMNGSNTRQFTWWARSRR